MITIDETTVSIKAMNPEEAHEACRQWVLGKAHIYVKTGASTLSMFATKADLQALAKEVNDAINNITEAAVAE